MSITPGSAFGALYAPLFVAIEPLLFLMTMEWVPSGNMHLGMPESNGAVSIEMLTPKVQP
jgi:hypothetical protein